MLRWQQDWSTTAAHWEGMIAAGRPAPEPFYERPEILPLAEFYWSSFCDLVTERQIGMDVGPIPYSKAREYAGHMGVTDADDFQRFWEIIRAVDEENRRLAHAESKKDGAHKDDKPPRARALNQQKTIDHEP